MTQSTREATRRAQDLPVESLRASPFEMFSTLMVKRLAFGGFGDEAWIPAPAHGLAHLHPEGEWGHEGRADQANFSALSVRMV